MMFLETLSLIITQYLRLPQLYSHPTKPLSVHYALNLFFRAQKPGLVLLSVPNALDDQFLPVLCSPGDVEVN